MLWRYPILWLSLWSLLAFVAHAEGSHPELEPVPLAFSPALREARTAYLAGEWDAAAARLQRFLRERPTDDPNLSMSARLLLAESLAQLRRYDDASRQYQALQKASLEEEQRTHVEFRIAELALLKSDHERAAKQFERFRERHASHQLDHFALPYLAKAIAGRGDTARARQLYEQAVTAYPDGPLADDSRLRLALLDYDEGQFDSTKQRLAEVVAHVSTDNQLHWDALYWLGMAEWKSKEFAPAVAHLTLLRDQRPHHEYAEASAYFAAHALHQSSQPRAAAAAFRQLHERRGNSEYAAPAQLGELRCMAVNSETRSEARHDSERRLRRAAELHGQLTKSADGPLRAAATRAFAEVLLARERYQQAWTLIEPTVEESARAGNLNGDWEGHYRGVHVAARALRGMGQSARAHELLGRVRLRLCSPELAEQVQLTRIRLATDLGNLDAATSQATRLERERTGAIVDLVRVELLRAQLAGGQLQEAHATFDRMQRASAAHSPLVQAARALAEASFAAHDFTSARAVYNLLLQWKQTEADHVQALSGLAWIDSQEGHYRNAVARLEQLLVAFPDRPGSLEAQRMLATNLARLGEQDRAIRVLTAFQGMDQSEPQRAAALYQLSRLLYDIPSRREDALRVVRQLTDEHPHYGRIDAAWYLRGMLEQEQDSAAAEESFSKLAHDYPTSNYWSDALYRLAEIRAQAKDSVAAKKYLTKLIAVRENTRVAPHALYLKGKLESSERQWVAARTTLRQLLDRFPASPLATVARYGIAESFYQQKHYDHATKLFDILAGQQLPTNEPWQAMIRLRRAQLFVRESKYLEAIQAASTVEESFEDFALRHEVDYVLGRAHAGRGEFSEAREYYQRVVDGDPTYQREISAIAKWMVGETFIHQREYAKAIPHFEQLVAIDRHSRWQALSLLQAAKCHEKLEQAQQAKQRYGQLVRNFPGTEWAGEAAYRLDLMDREHERKAEK